ncbi:DEKNAAC105585 [Brettanomyces naardenensis]|uniref:DEKNAAC105585 n=1 Tax=Brettanomyces naardenensis TaxID=13370 RepID=A0A448YU46_BRENA|nr:DEKNAAC105585 [Brettanomyces naardenensis]
MTDIVEVSDSAYSGSAFSGSGLIFQPSVLSSGQHQSSPPTDVIGDKNDDSVVPTQEDPSPIDSNTQLKYTIWKKNAPLLYDCLQTSTLVWPSLSVEWFPDVQAQGNSNIQRLLLGSYSNSFNSFENLQLCTIKIPNGLSDLTLEDCEFDPERREFLTSNFRIFNNDGKSKGALNLAQEIPHQGDINRAKIMPQNADLLATISNDGSVSIFDRTKKSNSYDVDELFSYDNDSQTDLADIKLKFHTTGGWGLDWNKFKEGELVTGAGEGSIALWDIKDGFTKPERTSDILSTTNQKKFKTCFLSPKSTLFCHDLGVNSVGYAWFHDSLIGTAGEDGKFKLFDTRSLKEGPALATQLDHPVNALDFDKQNQFGLALGDDRGRVILEDLRLLDKPQYIISDAHAGSITSVSWNYSYGNVLASCSADGLVKLWKFNGTDEPLMFVHGGHMLGVSDIAWNPNDPKMLASCSDDNSVHVWKPSRTIF